MINKSRITQLNDRQIIKKKFVLYWMQASQRTINNHALEYAKYYANKLEQPLVVYFGVTSSFPEANYRHYAFMLEGLSDVKKKLLDEHIVFVVRFISPEKGVIEYSKDASVVIVDRGYLRIQRQWRKDAADALHCPLIQVESDVVVPIEVVSFKEEYAAATIRPKINRLLSEYLLPVTSVSLVTGGKEKSFESEDISKIKKVLDTLDIDKSVQKSQSFHGGEAEAMKHLRFFIDHWLDTFDTDRNDPVKNAVSHMSPYLHFGQISPLTIALAIKDAKSPGEDAYLEELIVRRELAMNYVYYNPHYDSFEGLPNWAKTSVLAHQNDRREYVYELDDFEKAETHDPYWNAAQLEVVKTGKMHGYMRMYWGKKIIEWSKTPQQAYDTMLYLNNKYELDGRDPNGFTGVAWCFGKHDRPWKERSIFGKIRYMNDKGLQRKFAIDLYVSKIADYV